MRFRCSDRRSGRWLAGSRTVWSQLAPVRAVVPVRAFRHAPKGTLLPSLESARRAVRGIDPQRRGVRRQAFLGAGTSGIKSRAVCRCRARSVLSAQFFDHWRSDPHCANGFRSSWVMSHRHLGACRGGQPGATRQRLESVIQQRSNRGQDTPGGWQAPTVGESGQKSLLWRFIGQRPGRSSRGGRGLPGRGGLLL
jgi:hypothetical protein